MNMQELQVRLILAGLLIILVGFFYGLVYVFVVNHDPLLQLKDNYEPAFTQLTQQLKSEQIDKNILDTVDTISEKSTRFRRAIGAHTHSINLGLLLILLALLFNTAFANSTYKSYIATFMGLGVISYPLGLGLQAAGLILIGEGFALLGAVVVITCIALFLSKLFISQD